MFEVKKHLIKLPGNRLYLPVAARLVWFREEHKDWGIETRPVAIDTEKGYAIFEAFVYNADGKLMAKGTKMETARGFADYIEKAETGAIGRALAVAGFGTQFAPDLDEVEGGRIVDSPQPNRNGPQNQGRYGSRPSNSQPFNGPANDSAANPPANEGVEAESDHKCSSCEKPLTKGQEALSVRKFGIALCPDCQKERKAAESA